MALDWEAEMFGLPRLARHAAAGGLGESDQVRHAELLDRLRTMVPLVNRLKLRLPPIPLDEAEDQVIARHVEQHPSKPGVEEARLVDHGVSVWAIVGCYLGAERRDAAAVARAYDVPIEAVDAAITYYRRHQGAIDTRLAANEA